VTYAKWLKSYALPLRMGSKSQRDCLARENRHLDELAVRPIDLRDFSVPAADFHSYELLMGGDGHNITFGVCQRPTIGAIVRRKSLPGTSARLVPIECSQRESTVNLAGAREEWGARTFCASSFDCHRQAAGFLWMTRGGTDEAGLFALSHCAWR